jgi:hypothetical protein
MRGDEVVPGADAELDEDVPEVGLDGQPSRHPGPQARRRRSTTMPLRAGTGRSRGGAAGIGGAAKVSPKPAMG